MKALNKRGGGEQQEKKRQRAINSLFGNKKKFCNVTGLFLVTCKEEEREITE